MSIVLSIDFAFFFRYSFPEQNIPDTEENMIIQWITKKVTVPDIEKKLRPSDEIHSFWNILSVVNLDVTDCVIATESQSEIFELVSNIDKIEWLIVFDAFLDADVEYRSLSSVNWLFYFRERNKKCNILLVYPKWNELMFTRFFKYMAKKLDINIMNYSSFKESVESEFPAQIAFVSRSGGKTPPWTDSAFISFVLRAGMTRYRPEIIFYNKNSIVSVPRKSIVKHL